MAWLDSTKGRYFDMITPTLDTVSLIQCHSLAPQIRLLCDLPNPQELDPHIMAERLLESSGKLDSYHQPNDVRMGFMCEVDTFLALIPEELEGDCDLLRVVFGKEPNLSGDIFSDAVFNYSMEESSPSKACLPVPELCKHREKNFFFLLTLVACVVYNTGKPTEKAYSVAFTKILH